MSNDFLALTSNLPILIIGVRTRIRKKIACFTSQLIVQADVPKLRIREADGKRAQMELQSRQPGVLIGGTKPAAF